MHIRRRLTTPRQTPGPRHHIVDQLRVVKRIEGRACGLVHNGVDIPQLHKVVLSRDGKQTAVHGRPLRILRALHLYVVLQIEHHPAARRLLQRKKPGVALRVAHVARNRYSERAPFTAAVPHLILNKDANTGDVAVSGVPDHHLRPALVLQVPHLEFTPNAAGDEVPLVRRPRSRSKLLLQRRRLIGSHNGAHSRRRGDQVIYVKPTVAAPGGEVVARGGEGHHPDVRDVR
mmetsp:Transcript_25017/g.44561  ORF Transcript_25017/g.44561 Transcript_25017/m.44561 type:complete len:231 (+) Transcript_25017:808-1500(+)